MRRHSRSILATFAAILSTGSFVACQDTTVEPAAAIQTDALTAAALDSALLDEFHAEYVYLPVLADHGNVLPFFNVVVAEQRHSAAIAAALRSRSLPVPDNPWTLDNVPRFTSVRDACVAAAEAERANIALYDLLLQRVLPADVRQVFTANRRASLDRHLPAFEQCR